MKRTLSDIHLSVYSDYTFLCPRHEMAGAYSVTLAVPSFRPSVIIHFPIIISTTVATIQLKFDTWMCLMNIQVEFEFGFGPMIIYQSCAY